MSIQATPTAAAATRSGFILELLAERAARRSYADLSPQGTTVVQVAFIDTLGVTLAGAYADAAVNARSAALEPAAPTARRFACTVAGLDMRVNRDDAAFFNGIAAHALDYDDGNSTLGGHPSVVLVPAVLALGEELDASSTELAVAYAAGYDVLMALGRGLNPGHYTRGWHPTSTIGTFGAAAAGARLLRLNPERTAVALAIAASLSSGVKGNFGTMVKALHAGQAIRNGLLAASLAAHGYTANRSVLEGRQGFLEVYCGPNSYDLDAITREAFDGPAVNAGTNSLKRYPCCASTHSPISAAIQLHREHQLAVSDIAQVEVIEDAARIPHTDRPTLSDALAGKFSVQYVVARALLGGEVRLEHFELDAHRDPQVLALMARVALRAGTPGELSGPFAARVEVTTTSGEQLIAEARRPTDPITADSSVLWTKFRDCAGRALEPESVERLVEALTQFPDTGSARDLMSLARPGSRSATYLPCSEPITR